VCAVDCSAAAAAAAAVDAKAKMMTTSAIRKSRQPLPLAH